jgi:clan AA aspartic protease
MTIFGRVTANREAILKLVIIDDENRKIAFDAMIDTGFNGDLILPIDTVMELSLELKGYQKAVLGDGTISQFQVCSAVVIWDGVKKRVEVNMARSGALIGNGLLEGYKLEIEMVNNGMVTIYPLDVV